MSKLVKIIIFSLAVLLCFILSYFSIDIFFYAKTPAHCDYMKKTVTIDPGQPFHTTIKSLYKEKIIEHPFRFKLLARIKGYERTVKAGEYLLSPSMTPIEILDILKKGSVFLYKITIPEGYTVYQIASVIEKAGLGTEKLFTASATSKSLVQKMGIDAETFEGYLFPDTYFFPKNTSCEKIISIMVKRFWSAFTPELQNEAKKTGLSLHQIITLASIIEKEAGNHDELSIISSVFHNRLKKKMRLESDPTVIYGIRDFDGNITRKHLRAHTPYNTYIIQGLPPGPIANPGIKSIKAAIYPSKTNYFYFVSRKDKTHQFSTNIKDHMKAVRTYQLGRKR